MYFFFYLEPVCCSMSSSNCCFLTCIQFSKEAGQVVWCSHLFQKFPQFIVIHTVKGFGIVNKAEIDVFLELSYVNSLYILDINLLHFPRIFVQFRFPFHFVCGFFCYTELFWYNIVMLFLIFAFFAFVAFALSVGVFF